jgi:hypothetical protein
MAVLDLHQPASVLFVLENRSVCQSRARSRMEFQ